MPRRQLSRTTSTSLALALVGVASVVMAPASRAQVPEPNSVAAAIQDLDGNDLPDRMGDTVAVAGVITMEPFALESGTMSVLQDDAGLVLFASDSTWMMGVHAGDRVLARGVIGASHGQPHLEVTELSVTGVEDIPRPIQLSAASVSERASGMLVEVTGQLDVQLEQGVIDAGILDGTGRVVIYFPPALLTEPNRLEQVLAGDGKSATVRGILLESRPSEADPPVYYVMPVDPSNLVLPPVPHYWRMLATALLVGLAGAALYLSGKRRSAERAAADNLALVTRLQASEAALRDAEQRMRQLFVASPATIYAVEVKDGVHRATWISENITWLVGYTVEEASDPDWWPAHLHPADRDEAMRQVFACLDGSAGDHLSHSYRFRHKDGSYRWFRNDLRVVERSPGFVNAVGASYDITEERLMEQQLRRAERLSSMGTVIGGVAHELNNPLNAIINFAALLLENAHTESEREDLRTIVREGERASRIVSSLRGISAQTEPEEPQRSDVDLNDVVQHVLKLRTYSLSASNVTPIFEPTGDLPLVWGDRGQIEQVVLNLVINAEQAIADHRGSGEVRIRTRRGRLGAELVVSDDGPGIPAKHLDRIFDPFWTTKDPGKGTGLGLSLVHNIITDHDGRINVRSVEGTGTTFRIDLPTRPANVDAPEPPRPADPPFQVEPPASNLRVLVIDDEPALRSSFVRYLRRVGHVVDEAAEGAEALEKLNGPESYDAIVSDLRMPGMGGEDLVARLREDGRGLHHRLILVSGAPSAVESGTALQDIPILFKPIPLPDLARAVEERCNAARAMVGM